MEYDEEAASALEEEVQQQTQAVSRFKEQVDELSSSLASKLTSPPHHSVSAACLHHQCIRLLCCPPCHSCFVGCADRFVDWRVVQVWTSDSETQKPDLTEEE